MVYWPEEKTVSVVPRGKVTEGHTVNDKCCVKIGRQRHQGHIVAIGKNIFFAYIKLGLNVMQFVKVRIEPVIVGNQMLNILYSIIFAKYT